MKFINAVFALCFTAAAFAQKCCTECPLGQAKFYSIDTKYDRCGECCMDPEKFPIFKKFEKGLEVAEVVNPCEQLGYTVYENTETHGAFAFTMTLDKYSKPELPVEEELPAQEELPVEGEELAF